MIPASPGGCMLAVIGTLVISTAVAVFAFLVPVSSTGVALPTPGDAISEVPLDLENAETLWHAASIDSYRIKVQIGGAWRLNTYTITVQHGEITNAVVQCGPGMVGLVDCPEDAQAAAHDFTVAGLFTQLHSIIDTDNAAWLTASFDPALGYPMSMGFDHPEIMDEEWFINVLSFEALPD